MCYSLLLHRRGLFEEHKRLFSFLLCTSILRHPSSPGGISEAAWSCLIRGPSTTLACQAATNTTNTSSSSTNNSTNSSSSGMDRPRPAQLDWLPEAGWAGLQAIEQCLPELSGLTNSWQQQAAAWREW